MVLDLTTQIYVLNYIMVHENFKHFGQNAKLYDLF